MALMLGKNRAKTVPEELDPAPQAHTSVVMPGKYLCVKVALERQGDAVDWMFELNPGWRIREYIDLEKMIRRIDKHTSALFSSYRGKPALNYDIFPQTRR